MKTSELIGPALDWAVAKCENIELSQSSLTFQITTRGCLQRPHLGSWKPSTLWSQGGPIVERESIDIRRGNPLYLPQGNEKGDYYEPLWIAGKMHGQTPLIAAMRCYVASKLGDEVEIPEELL